MTDLFSVIVLLYNNSNYLFECLESILDQDYSNIEIIVADDHSEIFNYDEIVSFLETHKKNNLLNYYVYQNEINYGTVKSANRAIKKASGHFIKLLAADDALYNSESLSNAAKALNLSPCGIITSDVMNCDKNLNPISKNNKRLPKLVNQLRPADVFRRLCVHNDIVAGGVFFNKHFFKEYGLFDETYRLLEDWPTWLNITKNGCKFYYSPFLAIRYRSNGGIGTSVNPIYMKDKNRVLKSIIIPSKHELGIRYYVKARLYFTAVNSRFIRQIYGFFFRKGLG